MQNSTRNEVKQLAKTMESLAHEIQVLLDSGANILGVANELARNSSTFVFTLGGMYALDELGSTSSKVAAKGGSAVKPQHTSRYHNVRDSLGRFTRKI
jgi:uncharacterized protein YoxC